MVDSELIHDHLRSDNPIERHMLSTLVTLCFTLFQETETLSHSIFDFKRLYRPGITGISQEAYL